MNTKESVKELLLAVNNETTNQWEEITKKVNEDESLEFFGKWCKAQETMRKRYDIVNDILNMLRAEGWDVKIDMQDYHLSLHGRI